MHAVRKMVLSYSTKHVMKCRISSTFSDINLHSSILAMSAGLSFGNKNALINHSAKTGFCTHYVHTFALSYLPWLHSLGSRTN